MTERSGHELGTHVVAKPMTEPRVSRPEGRVAITRERTARSRDPRAPRAHGGRRERSPVRRDASAFHAERLQVVLNLDDPKSWVVAAWRDIYADHGQALEVDMALEALTDRHLCWNCGDLGVAERDDLSGASPVWRRRTRSDDDDEQAQQAGDDPAAGAESWVPAVL